LERALADRLFLSPPDVSGRERALVMEAFDSNYVAPAGPMLDRFEAELAGYTGFKHVVAVSSGTAALHLALHILGVGRGDGVIAPSLTFMGGVAPIHYVGATPVFVDVEADSWCLDPGMIEAACATARAAGLNPKVVLPADLYGQCASIDAIESAAAPLGLDVVLDSAEGIGALYDGRHAGKGARAAAYSFNGNKIITTSGGGALASDDADLIARARYLATAARQPVAHYEHTEIGYNYRLSSLSAAVGIGQLEQIEAKVARRRAIFERYKAELSALPGISFAPEAAHRRHTRWLSVMLIDPAQTGIDREQLRLKLEEANIESRPVWKPMHLQPVFAEAPRLLTGVSERLFGQGLCLPSGSGMSDADVHRVCDVIAKSIRAARPRAV
jgi:dTDP-4-amino-4,6-dideoxygalactose transaminase